MLATQVSYQFTRELRLLTPKHFNAVFNQQPQRFSSQHFTFLVTNNQEQHPRLGFAVAKKRVKLAVQRNRIKRLTRNSFRLQQHHLPAIDMVVMVRNGVDTLENSEIERQLSKIWRKIIQRYNS